MSADEAQVLVERPHEAMFSLSCSFCGKSQQEAFLVVGPCVSICEECVDLAADMVAMKSGRPIEAVAVAVERSTLVRDIAEVSYHARLWENEATRATVEIGHATKTTFPGPDPEWEENARERFADASRPLADCLPWLEGARARLREMS